MRLLVITQAVDTQDRALGFFHRWLEELASGVERVEVVCLKEGKHSLPGNARVHSLGKERGRSRIKYVFNFYRYVLSLRYDAVFVHMNEEYALLAGLWWRIMGKRVVLWRNHKMGSWRTRLAVALSSKVCYTSPDAFVARSSKAVRMPVGIDTGLFAPGTPAPSDAILFLGRLDRVKKAEVFVEALSRVTESCKISMYGSPTDPESSYAKRVQALAEPLQDRGVLTLHPGVPHERTPHLYRSHAVYANLTPSGSFDKTIGEAAACGCIVVCANEVLRGVLPEKLLVDHSDSADVARGLNAALRLSPEEREEVSKRLREYVQREHSLSLLVQKLIPLL